MMWVLNLQGTTTRHWSLLMWALGGRKTINFSVNNVWMGLRNMKAWIAVLYLVCVGLVPAFFLTGCGGKGSGRQSGIATGITVGPNLKQISPANAVQLQGIPTGGTGTVLWSVQGGFVNGTITSGGLYTAPVTEGTYKVDATLSQNTRVKTTISVVVKAGVNVTVTPKTTTAIIARNATKQFAVIVSNATNSAVTWSVGGGSGNGTVDATGLYTAPNQTGTFTVIATSVQDTTRSDSALVTVSNSIATGITLGPVSPSVDPSKVLQLTSTLTGGLGLGTVVWSVEGGAPNGTITTSGRYTAPATEGTYVVDAELAENSAVKSTISVLVKQGPVVTVSPKSPVTKLAIGAKGQFTATVTSATNTAVVWSVNGGDANGTITVGGLYTAPNKTGTFTVIARSAQDPTRGDSASVSVISGVATGIMVAPTTPGIDPSTTVQLNATLTGGAGTVKWAVQGGSPNGTVSATGLYTAPATPGTYLVDAYVAEHDTVKATATIAVQVGVSVVVTPNTPVPVMVPLSKLQFTATLTNASNTAVTWSVLGGSANGTIDTNGLYTAPSKAGSFVIIATSVQDVNRSGQATVTVSSNAKVVFTFAAGVPGDITIQLNTVAAPNTCANFCNLVNQGFYNGIKFHRFVAGSLVQGGDPLTKTLPLTDPSIGTGGPGYTIPFEVNSLLNVKYSIGMARTNAGLDTAGSQFYFNLTHNTSFDTQYCVFASTYAGTGNVDRLVKGSTIVTATMSP